MMASDSTDHALTWLHISDVHMGLEDAGDDRHAGIREFLGDLQRVQDTIGDIDLVLFTGDLTQAGTEKQFRELDDKLLTPLYAVLRGSPPLLAVPGNHDLQWTTTYAQGAVRDALCADPTNLWQREPSALEFVRERFTAFDAWWQGHPRRPRINFTPGLLPGDYVYVHAKSGVRFGIAGLNTAALHLHNEVKQGVLRVHKHQLATACDGDVARWLAQQHVNLLLTHHPPDWILGEDLDGGLRAADFDVHLFGHMHELLSTQVRYGSNLGRRMIQAASLFGLETYRRVVDGTTRKEVQRRYGYAGARIQQHDGPACVRLWPRRGFRQADGRWRMGPDGSFALQDDVLSVAIFDLGSRLPWSASTSMPATPPNEVETHPLWASASGDVAAWRTRCIELSRRCRAVWDDSARALAGPDDPWRDPDYPARILERLAASVQERLSAPRVFLLLAAPFVHEAAWATGLARLYRESSFEDLKDDPEAKEPRLTLQRMHRAYPRVVRLAERHGGAERRTLALWLLYRALAHLPRLCDARTVLRPQQLAELAGEAYEPLMDLSRCIGADTARILELHRSDRVVAGTPVELARLGALLASTSAAALDIRTVDELAIFHFGGAEGFTVEQLFDATNKGVWQPREDTYVFAHACSSPIEHYCVTDLVHRADATTKAMRDLPHGLGRGLPPELSATGVVPVKDGGRDRFRPIHVRFQLDHNRIRDLLMGEALYADPNLALRELYQNALDACRYRRARTECLGTSDSLYAGRYVGRIVFRHGVAADGREFVECEDDGVGMSQHMLERVFAVAGQRFHDQSEFMAEKERWEHLGIEYWPNSQHGIGVLSYFMLADEVELETREFRSDGDLGPPLAVRITSASGLFHVRDGDPSRPCGTRIRLYLQRPLQSHRPHRGPRRLLSALLRAFLVIAEFTVDVVEGVQEGSPSEGGRITHRWQPDSPDRQMSLAPTASPDLWWCANREGQVLADGVATRDSAPFLLVNLRGSRYPTLTADRKRTRQWDRRWIEPVLPQSGRALADLPGLWLGLLFDILCEHPTALEQWHELRSALPPLRLTPASPFDSEAVIARELSCRTLATTRDRRLRATEVRPERLDFLPADALLFDNEHHHALNALTAWRTEVWRTELGELGTAIHSANPRLPRDTNLPCPELGLALSPSGSEFMVLGSALDPVGALAPFTGFAQMQARVVAGLQWCEERLGLPLVDLAPAEFAALQHRDPKAATLTDDDIIALQAVRERTLFTTLLKLRWETDRPLAVLIDRLHQLAPIFGIELDSPTCESVLDPRVGESWLFKQGEFGFEHSGELTYGDVLVIAEASQAPVTKVLTELERLSDAIALRWTFDPGRAATFKLRPEDRILLSVDLDGKDPWLVRRLPLIHLLFASRHLQVPFEQLTEHAAVLADVFGLELPAKLVTPSALTDLEWLLLSRDLDGALPRQLETISGVDVAESVKKLGLPISEITKTFAGLAARFGLKLEYDRVLIEALDSDPHFAERHFYSKYQRGRSGWEASTHWFLEALTEYSSYHDLLTREFACARALAIEVRPGARFLLDPSCDALAEQLRAQPEPYEGFDAGRCVRLWLLQAVVHLPGMAGDIQRALLCAGRWWLWWLSDVDLQAFGRALEPVLAAEVELPTQTDATTEHPRHPYRRWTARRRHLVW